MEKNEIAESTKAETKPKSRFRKLFDKFDTQNGRQNLSFVFGMLTIILIGTVITLVRVYMDSDGFDSFTRNIALGAACVADIGIVFTLSRFILLRKDMRKRRKSADSDSGDTTPAIGRADPFIASVLLAVNSYLLPDFVMFSYFPKANVIYILLGILLCWLFYLVGIILFPKPHAWFGIVSGFFTLYAVLQYYIMYFRGNPIQFADLANLSTVSEVTGMYEFPIAAMPVFAVVNFACTLYLIVTTNFQKKSIPTKLISCGGLALGVAIIYYGGSFAYDLGIKNRYIRLNFSGAENADTYATVGYDLMFCFDGMFNRVSKPDGYSTEKAEDILTQFDTEKSDKKPTIIAIMNESFADFEHIAEFKTNKDYMPNYHKLQSESISGYVSVSAYGGYSCNSEYEFLTGNTLGFLPSGSAVFTQYLDEKQNGLVTWLNELGYFTQAVSPCTEGLWNIGGAYENLQFKEKIFNCQNNISNVQYINDNMSDETLFHYIEAQYENHKDNPYFVWTATMQNHGPYDNADSVPSEITFEDYNDPEALQYLNSIYQSDKALGELVDYFRDRDDEVIIVMFGDHYPHIINFTEHLYGNDVALLSTEDYSRLRQTPFIIWSNKGLEAKTIEDISLNYLSNEVMDAAGLPKSRYQQELDVIRQQIPIISSYGYKTAEGNWYAINEIEEEHKDILNTYETVQYYRMFDKNRDSKLN
ncbi:LTA synthase family protein [Ruminococcus sp.]|uniref:LTA synthase family protein n=1 Tax=Ruminococcus sp. TaxID=41978 RepID=UPI0025D796EA|nr:LTA synthase family protein [Ruminococcus sp.]